MDELKAEDLEQLLPQGAREWIDKSIGRLQKATKPTVLVAGLVGATLMPAVWPIVTGVAGGKVAEALIGQVAKLGGSYLKHLVHRFVDGCRAKNEDEAQQQLEATLAKELETAADAPALRSDVARLLQAVGGIPTALAAASDEIRQELGERFAELGWRFDEFRFVLAEVRHSLEQIAARQAEQLALQRTQIDLAREHQKRLIYLIEMIEGRVTASTSPTGEGSEVKGPNGSTPPAPVPCPYKGLAAFEPGDARWFFGRERLIADWCTRLSEQRVLVVVGASGSGKSSAVRAGLVPRISSADRSGSAKNVLIVTPGSHPLEELGRRLAPLVERNEISLIDELEKDPSQLPTTLPATRPAERPFVLVVDQFEEVFTLCRAKEERRRFVRALVAAATAITVDLKLIIVLRSDFYEQCAEYPELVSCMQDNQVLVGAMDPEELRAAIEKPAAAAGLTLDDGLVELLIEDVAGEPGALPLLSHALVETWRRRRGSTLTLTGYRESGGVRQAIARTAESIYSEQLDEDRRRIARRLILALTELGEGTQTTRRRMRRSDLVASTESVRTVEVVLDKLVSSRLLTTSDSTVEVAHEAVLREWPRLQAWLAEDREGLRIHRHLARSAQEWAALGRDAGELYRGGRLVTAAEWAAEHQEELAPLERQFLDASQAERARELTEARRRKRRRTVVLSGVSVVAAMAVLAAALATSATNRARSEARLARSRQQAARAMTDPERFPAVALASSIAAITESPTVEAESALLRSLQVSPRLSAFLPGRPLVKSLDWHPKERRLAVGAGGALTVWDTTTRQRIWSTEPAPPAVVDWSPDGATLAVAAFDTIHLVDGATGNVRREPLTNADDVISIAWRPDGRVLAAGTAAGAVVWGAEGGGRIGVLEAGDVTALGWRPDGRVLATARNDGSILLWDAETGQFSGAPLARSRAGSQATSLDWSPDGRLLAAGTQEGVTVWDVDARQPRGDPLKPGFVKSVAWSRDGRTLAGGTGDRIVVLWDLETGRAEFLHGHRSQVLSVSWSADGQTLASGGIDPSVILWSPAVTDRLAAGTVPARAATALDVSNDGATLNVGTAGGSFERWDLPRSERTEVRPGPSPSRKQVIAFSPDISLLAVGRLDGILEVWDVGGQKLLGDPAPVLDGEIGAVAWVPARKVVAVGNAAGALVVWDIERRQPLARWNAGSRILALGWRPDGNRLAISTADQLLIWEPAGAGSPVKLQGRGEQLLAWSPDGVRLAGPDGLGRVYVWDVGRKRSLRLDFHTERVTSIAWSPDGRLLASGSRDRTVRLWHGATGQQLGNPFGGHDEDVDALAWSGDGRRLASASSGRAIVRTIDIEHWRQQVCRIFTPVERPAEPEQEPLAPYPAACRKEG